MALLSLANVVYNIGTRCLLDGASVTLDEGQRIGLVGRNGCGKSTLLKLIAGMVTADSGQIQLARGRSAGYLTQDPQLDPTRTLREEAGSALGNLAELEKELDQVMHEMETAQGDELQALLDRYEHLEGHVHAAGGLTQDHRVDATLHGVGLGDELFDVPVTGLSGGQKSRLALAKLLLMAPDVLLLDEPTNHLDIAGREWLEEYLSQYQGAVILVSHDRWLLDRAVQKIYELENGILVEYPGNYAQFREQRVVRQLTLQRQHQKQKEHIKREQAFIDRYRAGQRASQAQGREKRLERFVRDEAFELSPEMRDINLQLSARTRPGDLVITTKGLSKNYPGKPLFDDISITINRGDRIGIIGPNGAGKTTLINCMLGVLEADAGQVRVGPSVDVGHYHQNHDHLKLDQTVVEYLRRFVPAGTEQQARNLAGAFLFTGQEQDKVLGMLSGGERSRTVLAGLMAQGHNLLVLDEPTNHLDIPSAERLEEALVQYTKEPSGWGEQTVGGGTLLLISHDRMLLDTLATQLLIFDGCGNCTHFDGTYSEYLQVQAQKKEAQQQAASSSSGSTATATATKPAQQQKNATKNKTAPRKNAGAESKLSSKALEQKIVEVETELADVDQQLADPDVYRDGNKVKSLQSQRDKLRAQLEPLEEEWLRRAEDAQ